MKRIIPALILVASLVVALSATGQPAPPPFGFEKIHFGMTLSEAEPLILTLAPRIQKAPVGTPSDPELFVGPYKWQDCTFDVGFYFEGEFYFPRGRLSGIVLYLPPDATEKCFQESYQELSAHLGSDHSEATAQDQGLSSNTIWYQQKNGDQDRSRAALRRLKAPLPVRYFYDLDDASRKPNSGAGSILIEEWPGPDVITVH